LCIEYPAKLPGELKPEPAKEPRKLLQKPILEESSGFLFGVRAGSVIRIISTTEQPGTELVGIFAWRERGEVFLTDSDLASFERNQALFALVVCGDRGGFFFREPDGRIQAIRSHEEFSVSTTKKLKPRRRVHLRLKQIAALAAVTVLIPTLPIAALAYLRPMLPPPPLALAVSEQSGQLLIRWNGNAIGEETKLEVTDNGEHLTVPLSTLQTSATYVPRGSDIDVRLITMNRNGTARWQVARFVRSSNPPPAIHQGLTDRVKALEDEADALKETLAERRSRTDALLKKTEHLLRREP